MKINSFPDNANPKDSDLIITSTDGIHMSKTTRKEFLKGYGGGGKGGEGSLQYFTETEHALTGSVRYNGLSDETLDETVYAMQNENSWFDEQSVPRDFVWGRLNGAVTGVGYTYGEVYNAVLDAYYDGSAQAQEGDAPTAQDYYYSVLGHENGNLQAFNYIFKKTNPGLTYFVNVCLPPRWADYTEGSTHTKPSSQNSDWDFWTLMFCETEQPTFELYQPIRPEDRPIIIDYPDASHPAGDGQFSQAIINAIDTYLATDDPDTADLLIDI